MWATVLGVTAVLCGPTAGWQPLETGGYQYIVQVSPDEVDMLQDFGDGFTSAVPSHVRDFREVVVRIGTGSVPQDPPIPHGDSVVATSGTTTSEIEGNDTTEGNDATRHTVQRPQLELPSPPGGTSGVPGVPPNGGSNTGSPTSPWATGNGTGFGNLPTRGASNGSVGGANSNGVAAGAAGTGTAGTGTAMSSITNSPSAGGGTTVGTGTNASSNTATTVNRTVATNSKSGGTTASPFASSPFAMNTGSGSSGATFPTLTTPTTNGTVPPESGSATTNGTPQWSNGTLFFLLLLSLSLNAYLIYITLDTRNRYFRLMSDQNDTEHDSAARRSSRRYADADVDEPDGRDAERYADEQDVPSRERSRPNSTGRMERIREMSRSAMSHLRRRGDHS